MRWKVKRNKKKIALSGKHYTKWVLIVCDFFLEGREERKEKEEDEEDEGGGLENKFSKVSSSKIIETAGENLTR